MTKTADGCHHKQGALTAPTSIGVSRASRSRGTDAGRAPSAVSLRAGYSLIALATVRGVVPAETGLRLCGLIQKTEGSVEFGGRLPQGAAGETPPGLASQPEQLACESEGRRTLVKVARTPEGELKNEAPTRAYSLPDSTESSF